MIIDKKEKQTNKQVFVGESELAQYIMSGRKSVSKVSVEGQNVERIQYQTNKVSNGQSAERKKESN